jgi:hypothetical protein
MKNLVLLFIVLSYCFNAQASCDTPVVKTTSITSKQMVVYWDTVTGALQYQYRIMPYPAVLPPTSGSFISGNTALASGLQPGSKYVVCVRTICLNDTSVWICDTASTEPTGIHSVAGSEQQIKVYPNPVTSKLTLEFPEGYQDGQLVITDVLGKVVYRSDIHSSVQKIDVQTLQTGVYFIKYATGNYSENIKLLKE